MAAVVALAPMVWAFGRLHRNAPSAGSTSDVVGKVLGGRTGLFTGLLQLAGYCCWLSELQGAPELPWHCCWSMTSNR